MTQGTVGQQAQAPGGAGSGAQAPALGSGPGPLRSRDVVLMSVAAGISVANIYYLQPILRPLAASLGISAGAAGLLPTLTLAGYAAGLLFVVPMADRFGTRRLSLWLNIARVIALAGCAAAPGFAAFAAASLVLGVSSIIAQILIPLAVSLSSPGRVGRVTGSITAGLFGGILGARVLSGAVSDAVGWRWVYVISAVLTLILALALRNLPEAPGRPALPYRELLGTLWGLVRREQSLRQAVIVASSGFAAFNLFWTAVTLYVTGPPHHWSTGAAGSLGLVGVAGTLTALAVGRYLDRGWYRPLTVTAATVMTAALLLAMGGGQVAVLLVAGALLLDSGARISSVTNQSHALSSDPAARIRLNTIYMTSYFTAGSIGSALGSLIFTAEGWTVTCLLAAALTAVSAVCALARRSPEAQQRDQTRRAG